MNLSRWISGAVLFLATAAPQQRPAPRPAQPTRPAAPRPAYMQQLRAYEEGSYVTRAVLKNGLTVLVNEFRGSPVVALVTYSRTGPLDEPADRTGASSELARRLFRASSTRAAGVIEADLRALAGRLRAFAAFGHTTSALVAPAIQWKRGLELQADALLDPLLDAGERKGPEDPPGAVLRSRASSPGESELLELGFGRNPFGAPAAADVPRAKLLEQHRLLTSPGRMVLAVSGDVNAVDVLAEAVRVYAKASGSERMRPLLPRPEPAGFRYRQVRRPAAAAEVEVGFPAPGIGAEDYPALAVAAALLGAGDAAIVPRRLRDQKKVILDGSAEMVAEDGAGLLRIAFDTEVENLDRAEIALFAEIELLKRIELDAAELARARAQLERAHWLALESVEGRENAGITSLMLRSILGAGKDAARQQFYRQLEIYGGRIVPVVEDDYFGFRLNVLSPNIEATFDLIFGLIKGPKFDADTVKREKARQLVDLRRDALSLGARHVVEAAVFGEFSYALGPFGTESSLGSLTPEKVAAWHKSSMEYRKPVVILIGDTQGTSLARYFVRNFSGSHYEDIKVPETAPKPLAGKAEASAVRQGDIAVGFQAPPAGDEDSYAVMVLQAYAGGPAGKLETELRDRLQAVSTVDVDYRPRLRGGSLTVRAACKSGEEEKALAALEQELRKLPTATVLYRDYRTAINRAVAAYWIDQQSHSAQVDRMMGFVLEGRGVDEIVTHPARIQAVREEDLGPIAKRILTLDKAVIARSRAK
jgi:predicted Zn-dependent peptidase